MLWLCFKLPSRLFGNNQGRVCYARKSKVFFIYLQPQKVKFKSVQINMKQVSYNETTPAFIVLNRKKEKYKGLIAHTNARTHTNTFSNDYFYPCHYFPPQMHLSEIL